MPRLDLLRDLVGIDGGQSDEGHEAIVVHTVEKELGGYPADELSRPAHPFAVSAKLIVRFAPIFGAKPSDQLTVRNQRVDKANFVHIR